MDQGKTTVEKLTIASLEEVMKYENMDVIDRFRESWDVPLDLSIEIFNEMKKWLWLCADKATRKAAQDKIPRLAITFSMTLLDEMWHAFILFTKPYAAFCNTYFGFYIHHGPTTKTEKDEIISQIKKSKDVYLNKIEKDLTLQYEYVYEQLGEDTLKKWYSEWTDLYKPDYLNKLYKKQW